MNTQDASKVLLRIRQIKYLNEINEEYWPLFQNDVKKAQAKKFFHCSEFVMILVEFTTLKGVVELLIANIKRNGELELVYAMRKRILREILNRHFQREIPANESNSTCVISFMKALSSAE
nr:hypothetical transcript [Hymenolepis microstoma]